MTTPAPVELAAPPAVAGPLPFFPAVVVAGDRSHARAVAGRSKAFIPIAGKPMVVHVVEALLRTPEVSEVFVVGDHLKLEQALATAGVPELAMRSGRALRIVPQRDTLYDNVWYSFLRTGPGGAMPAEDHAILVVPADIPLVLPEELSDFVRQAAQTNADYVLGLSPDIALERFAPRDGQIGIEMACFNLKEGRFRQNNLHLVRPLRMGNRHYIEDMYETRHQKELMDMVRLALRVFVREFRNLWVLVPYLFLHVAGILDRRGWKRAARLVRHGVSVRTVERAAGALLRTHFRTVVTGHGGAALDVDNDPDCEVADKMFAQWKALQLRGGPHAIVLAHE
jgi:CTP:molybdopterin cytidylyltransferase MocA